jgi:hypothetical protein
MPIACQARFAAFSDTYDLARTAKDTKFDPPAIFCRNAPAPAADAENSASAAAFERYATGP